MRLIAELKRRKVFRVASVYAVSAWVVLQIADVTLQPLGFPPWIMTALTVIAISGLPVSVVFGWYFDISSDGLSRTKPSASTERVSLRSIDYLVLSTTLAIALAFSFSAYRKIASDQVGHADSGKGRYEMTANTIVEPTAFDRYLEGVELMKRWDLDSNLDLSMQLFDEATSLDPDFALAFARLADVQRYRYALTRDEAWLSEAINNMDEAVRLNPDLAPVQVVLSKIHVAQGNIDLGFSAAQRALSIDANDASAKVQMARVCARLGRTQDADTFFREGIALDPEDPSIRNSFAVFLNDQGRNEEAIDQWQVTIRLAPDHWAALLNLGGVLADIGRTAEAITILQRSLEVRPSFMGYSNLGTAYSFAGRYEDAAEAFNKALQIDGTDWLPWGNLGFVYSWIDGMDSRGAEAFDKAIKLAETSRQRSPRDPWVHSDLALYYAKTNQPQLAILRLNTAVALAPDSAEILAAAAETYELIGQRDKAVENALASLDLGVSPQRFRRSPDLASLIADPRINASVDR